MIDNETIDCNSTNRSLWESLAMNREMHRNERKMTDEQILETIKSADYGILSVLCAEGFPYGVPVNYGYADGKFYIHHTVAQSLLSDCLQKNDKVCFTIVSRHDMDKEIFSTHYDSVIVFGSARIITESTEKIDAMMKMMYDLAPDKAEVAQEHCKTDTRYIMIELTPSRMTGKHRG